MKHICTLLILLIALTQITAQNSNRIFKRVDDRDTFIEVIVSDGKYQIQPITSEIVETTFLPEGEVYNSESHAVIYEPDQLDTRLSDLKNEVVYNTSGIIVTIQKQPFKISYAFKSQQLISEDEGYYKTNEHKILHFKIDNDEILYGGGARALGMNRRGHKLELYNKAHYGYEERSELMNYTMPIVISSKRYMVHFDNPSTGYLDLDSNFNNSISYQAKSGRMTYQVIAGDSWLDLIDNYTDLTGKQPMPPRWAFGNFVSRFGYHSQQQVENTINKFKESNIPVDAVILDIYWFGKTIKGTMGNLEVYKDSFPNFTAMVNKFKDRGIKTIAITEPFILTTSKRWKEAVNKNVLATTKSRKPYTYNFYFGNTGLIDIYKPEGKKWFWNIYRDMKKQGLTGVWGDLGEPEVHPSDIIHGKDKKASEVHNIYGHDWARLIHEGYRRDYPDERPFILMRSGYSGSQHFGLIPWSGDVNRSWGGFKSQPEIALQMGMQGLAYMHSDLGGFAGDYKDKELYLRWLQYGVFQPIFRPHAQESVPSEAVYWDTRTKLQAKKIIELRYKMLPYNYTTAFKNNQTGAPLMRPAFFENDRATAPELKEQALFFIGSRFRNLYTKTYSFLWGNDFLVAPVLEKDRKFIEVYFPDQSNWFNFYNDVKLRGGNRRNIKVDKYHIPTYVRGGAFIPLAKPMQTTEDYNPNDFELHYYHDEDLEASAGEMYNDDGKTAYAFEKDMYEMLFFDSKFKNSNLEFDFYAETGKLYETSEKKIKFILHNISIRPKQVKVDDLPVDFVWDKSIKTLRFNFTWDTELDVKIDVKFKTEVTKNIPFLNKNKKKRKRN